MTSNKRSTYSAEFKHESAQLVIDENYSVREAAKSLGIGKSTLDKWVRQLKNERNGIADQPSAITPDKRKIKELEKRIKRIEMEKEILKKATALLMSDSISSLR